jgi:signal transduction histidine kinase
MKASAQNQSLRKRFRNLSIRWSFIGLVLTILVVVPTVFAIIRHSSERQVEVMATALTRAFRPMILKDQVRDAQLQMENVAKLKSGELVTVLDQDSKPIYLERLGDKTPDYCSRAATPCWLAGGTRVSISAPIYFDDDTKNELYGYLILTLKPTVDWYEIALIVLGGGLVFIFQIFGFYSSLKGESYRIERVLANWKTRIDNPKVPEPEDSANKLFEEFVPLNRAVESLHRKISGLESAAAKEAATKAKIEIVRGIGHDLKTPLSNLSKYFEILVTNVNRHKTINQREIERIEYTMKLMGSIIRQVTNFGRRSEKSTHTNLTLWLTAYTNELKTNAEILKNNVVVSFDSSGTEDVFASVDEIDLFRLIDNITRNAVEAFPANREVENKISISLRTSENGTEIYIVDNGLGIPETIQGKIFDLDFTTKKTRGTGLGLGIVRKICDDVGLKISFSSEENSGTRFTVQLPSTKIKISGSLLRGEVNI